MAGSIGLVLALETLFRILPVSSATKTGYHIDPNILTYAPNHRWRVSTGWDLRNPQSLASNGHGFVSHRSFEHNSLAVALIGDSYVEASSLDAADRPGTQLEVALEGRRPVYAMGAPGTSLLDYAERIRYAHEHFGVTDFVVLVERGDPLQSLCGSGNVSSPCLDPVSLTPRNVRASPPSLLKRIFRESAFAQYFAGQLKLDAREFLRQLTKRADQGEPVSERKHSTPAEFQSAPRLRAIDAVTVEFFARINPFVKGQLIIVVDVDRSALMRGEAPSDLPRQRFIELARQAGATVLDPTPTFREHFENSSLSLELSPQDAHFNALTSRLVARLVAQHLDH